MVQVPEDLVKLYIDIYLTVDLFFVNSITFFLTIGSNILFTDVNHIANKKCRQY